MRNLNMHEPMPVRKDGEKAVWPEVWADLNGAVAEDDIREAVIQDMRDRDAIGWERYGGPLVTNDGRDPLVDMYQELLDASVYAKKGLLGGGLTQAHAEALTVVYARLLRDACTVRGMIREVRGE